MLWGQQQTLQCFVANFLFHYSIKCHRSNYCYRSTIVSIKCRSINCRATPQMTVEWDYGLGVVCSNCAETIKRPRRTRNSDQWTSYTWNTKYFESTTRLRAFIPISSTRLVGMCLLWTALGQGQSAADCCWAIPFVNT